MRVLQVQVLELRVALSGGHPVGAESASGSGTQPLDSNRGQPAAAALGIVFDIGLAQSAVHRIGQARRPKRFAARCLQIQRVRRRLLIGQHDEELRRNAQTGRSLHHRVQHLLLVELLAGNARDPFALLHELKAGGCADHARHPHDIVHVVSVQAVLGGDENVVLAALLKLIEQEEVRAARLPCLALGELEEIIEQCGDADILGRVDIHRALEFAGDIAQLNDRGAVGNGAGQPPKGQAATAAGPSHDPLEVGPDRRVVQHALRREQAFQLARPAAIGSKRAVIRQVGAGGQPALAHSLDQGLRLVLDQIEDPHQRGGIGRSYAGHVALRQRKGRSGEVARLVIGNIRDFRRQYVFSADQLRHPLVQKARS